MSYGQRYKVHFNSFQSDVKIYINDKNTFTEDVITPIDTDIEGSAFSLTIDDTDEDKFTAIRAKKLSIDVFSNSNTSLTSFVFGDDDRWFTQLYIDDVLKFEGYLVIDESSQEFLPNESRCIISLVATDNLGLLKDIELTRFDGAIPWGQYPIIDFIAWSLKDTTLELPIVCAMNLYEEDYQRETHAILKELFINGFTFEKEIGSRVSKYETLTMILTAFGCYLSQYEGKWWIIRTDEVDFNQLYTCEFTHEGILTSIGSGLELSVNVGINNEIYFSQGTTTYKYKRAAKFVKQIFNYTTPREALINIDFSRGDFSSPESGIGFNAYRPEGWIYRKGWPNVTQDSSGYIKAELNQYGDEEKRFLHMPITVSNAMYYWEAGNRIPVHESDKFEFGLDFKHSNDLGGGSGNFALAQAQIRLHGNDGTKWTLKASSPKEASSDPGPTWVQSNSTFSTNNQYVKYEGKSEHTDFTQWQSLSIESSEIPVSGELEFFLMNNQTPHQQSKSFQNLRFTYVPLINGSYRKYKGQHHKIEQGGTLKSNVEQTIAFSDSPKRFFNGAIAKPTYIPAFNSLSAEFNPIGAGNDLSLAGVSSTVYNSDLWRVGNWIKITGSANNNGLFRIDRVSYPSSTHVYLYFHKPTVTESATITIDSVAFVLAESWYNAARVDEIGLERLGKHTAFALWNQYFREMVYYEYTMQGEEGESIIPDIINKYRLTDTHIATRNKIFAMLTFEMMIKECEYTGMLAEVYDSAFGKDYESDHEFKYITE